MGLHVEHSVVVDWGNGEERVAYPEGNQTGMAVEGKEKVEVEVEVDWKANHYNTPLDSTPSRHDLRFYSFHPIEARI